MRGAVDTDRRDFAQEMLPLLSKAAVEASYLADHGYPRDSYLAFVGNRYQLTERQRLLLARSVSGQSAKRERTKRLRQTDGIAGERVLVDGFNAIITLEVALSGGPVVRCQDGTVRDLAGLKGTYHPIAQTSQAIRLLLKTLSDCGATVVEFRFDRPVSNSGRLCELVRKVAAKTTRTAVGKPPEVLAYTCTNVDRTLFGQELVASSDSLVIDRCASWINLAAVVIDAQGAPWQIALDFSLDYQL